MNGEMKTYTVYMHEFPNGKVYIGMTSQKPSARWKSGNGYRGQTNVWSAIAEYGWRNIRHNIIELGLTREEAEVLEKALIQKHRANDPEYGYNIENGGMSAGKVSEETKKKLSEAHTGEKNPFYGRPLSKEHKGKIRNTRKERDIQPVNKRPVLCIETGIIYESTAQATRELGIHNFALRRVCYGERKTAGGYHWKYVDG